VKKQEIQDIQLGHQQLLFGFESSELKGRDIVMSCIINQTEKHGYVVLDEFIQYVKEFHDLSEFEILQHIFWIAQDSKIHFRMDEKNLEPYIVKKVLLKSTGQSIKIITNKSVDDSVFQDVKRFYEKLSGQENIDHFDDQYEFARFLAKEIRDWESCLKSHKFTAQKPYFPGKKKIDDSLRFIKKISTKLDPFSLINTFYNNKEKIIKLVDDVRNITGFYTRHIDIWKTLIQSVKEFSENLPELKKDSEIATGFDRLKQILSSPEPYEMITETGELLKKVKSYHDIIVEKKTKQCRATALLKIDHMIEGMKDHLNAHKANQDLRNKSLYFLRRIKNLISNAGNIKDINNYLNDAEDMLDTFREEIKES